MAEILICRDCTLCSGGAIKNNLQLLGFEKVQMIGIDTNPDHVKWANLLAKVNGFHEVFGRDSWRIVNGALTCAKVGGTMQVDSGAGNFGGSVAKGSTVSVPTMNLASLLDGAGIIDIIHFDIQGWEYDVIKCSRELLRSRVRRIHIGVHHIQPFSPELKSTKRKCLNDFLRRLLAQDFILEYELKCGMDHDGVLAMVNKNLGPRDPARSENTAYYEQVPQASLDVDEGIAPAQSGYLVVEDPDQRVLDDIVELVDGDRNVQARPGFMLHKQFTGAAVMGTAVPEQSQASFDRIHKITEEWVKNWTL